MLNSLPHNPAKLEEYAIVSKHTLWLSEFTRYS